MSASTKPPPLVTPWDAVRAVLEDMGGVATVHQVAQVLGVGDDAAGAALEEARTRRSLLMYRAGRTKTRLYATPMGRF